MLKSAHWIASTPAISLINKVKASCSENQTQKQEDACVQQIYQLGDLHRADTSDILKQLCLAKVGPACHYYFFNLPVRKIDFWQNYFGKKQLPSWSAENTAPKVLIEYVNFEYVNFENDLLGLVARAEAVALDSLSQH